MNRKYIILMLLATVCAGYTLAQTVALPKSWKFNTIDDPLFSTETYDDHAWAIIRVTANWEEQGFAQYNGIGWYRVNVDIAPEMLHQDLVLWAGLIDDADETWFNGVRIGQTGKFPPDDQSAWDTQRRYTIPAALVKSRNTLAIRVYDGTGGGGIYGGRLELTTAAQYEKERKAQLKNKKSWNYLTTSNGLIAAVYNASTQKVDAVYPHIFSAYDSAQLVEPFVTNIALGTRESPRAVRYLQNTHVIEAVYKKFTVHYMASFSRSDKVFYVVVRGAPELVKPMECTADLGVTAARMVITERKRGRLLEKCFLFGFKDQYHPESGLEQAEHDLAQMPHTMVDAEVQWMQEVFKRCRIPAGLRPAERALTEQSISVLKMAQVADNEVFPLAKGQILASLRPGVWCISWVRDGAFALDAMTRLGMYAEARKGLEFMLNATPSGQYVHYIHSDGKDYGIGVDYQISVTRYFGNGREESDYADTRGPNIEIDDFGLFLASFCNYVNASGDMQFLKKWQSVVQHKVADPILHNIQSNGIIRPDSGPWEHHLPGRSFVFTSGVCCVGLEKWADLAHRNGLEFAQYINGAERLRNGILQNMGYENRLIKGNAQDMNPSDHYFYDGATFELFAGGCLRDSILFRTHMTAYDTQLKVGKGKKTGYIRFNSSDSYENQEWPFASLRVAVAHLHWGDKAPASLLINRVTDIASRNYNLIPEIIALDDEAYKGSIPMVGYGAGAYILALFTLK